MGSGNGWCLVSIYLSQVGNEMVQNQASGEGSPQKQHSTGKTQRGKHKGAPVIETQEVVHEGQGQ